MEAKEYIVLLRGINVSGKNKILMEDLRTLCQKLGYTNVRSYIQSGNLLLCAIQDPEGIKKDMEEALAEAYGYSVQVLVRTPAQWTAIIDNYPYENTAEKERYVTFFSETIVPFEVDCPKGKDRFHVQGDCAYIHTELGYGKTKFSNAFLEKKSQTTASTRNWKTILTLQELLR